MPYSKQVIRNMLLWLAVGASIGGCIQETPSISSVPVVAAPDQPVPDQPSPQQLTLNLNELFERAVELANESSGSSSPKLEAETLSQIALQLTYANRTEQAETIFAKAIAMYPASRETVGGADQPGDVIALNLAKAGKIEPALQRISQMHSSVMRIKTQANVAVEMVSADQRQSAEALLAESLEAAQALTDTYMSNSTCYTAKGDALSAVAASLAQMGQIETALTAAKQTPNCQTAQGLLADYQTDAYRSIIEHLKTPEQVRAVYAALPAPDAGTGKYYRAHIAIATQLANLNEPTAAQQIIETFDLPEQMAPNDYTIARNLAAAQQAIAISFARQGEFRTAMRIIEHSILNDEDNALHKSLALVSIGEQFSRVGKSQRAASLFEQALETVAANHRYESFPVIAALIDAGEIDLAIQTVPVDAMPKFIRDVVIALAEAGEYERSLAFINMLSDVDERREKAVIIATLAAQIELSFIE
ncbi:MAG: tetratricopeptide repeat protein [Cyanobacteria bacterium P01_A01_bin.114]